MSKPIVFVLVLACLGGTASARAADTDLADTNPGKKAAVDWLKSHFKPSPGAKNILADVSKFPEDEKNLTLTLGPLWMKSGKGAQVCLFDGEFFPFEFTPTQFEKLGIQKDGASGRTGRSQIRSATTRSPN